MIETVRQDKQKTVSIMKLWS